MKKIIALLLAMIMVLCMFAGCANDTEAPADDQTETNNTPTTPSDNDNEEEEDNNQEEEQTPPESETPVVFPWMQAIGVDTYFENPHHDNQSFMTQLIFQPVQEYDVTTGEYVDMVGTNWTVSEDYMTFSIDLVDGWTWHDGEPVTVDDIIFSLYDAALNPQSTQQGGYDKVVGIDAVRNGESDTIEGIWAEGNTVYVQLSEPNAHWNNARGIFLLPAHCFEGVAWADVDYQDYWKSPIGCGRMMVTEVSMPDYFMATRYDNYAGCDPVGFKNAKFVGYETGASDAAVTALMTGELDFAGRQVVLDGDTAASIMAQNPDVYCMGMTAFSHRVFVANMGNWRADGKDNSYMQDARVRKAIDLLIDQDKIAAMYPGAAVATKTITPSTSAEYAGDLVADYPSYDPDQAKALLDEAGFDYSQTIDLFYYYDDPLTHDIMAMMAQDFAAAGVTLNAQVYVDNLTQLIYEDKNYDIIYCAMGTDSIFNTSCMFQLSSGASYTYMGDCDGRYEKIDPIFAAYNATVDPDELKEYAHQAQAENLENCWMMPGYYQAFFSGYNTTTLSIPLEYFETYTTNFMNWSAWKVLK